ncbi:uncharacterized protein A1O5_11606 [Cladophialophora psammophila CBS 110553]|uniref:Heterokaryon incompatibility domain-containing protein n=1 Tax=Cladophialophora psammophila CBS 110553 TaxID=1182543 RepID=W9WE51_9EURO|nr:uncharacterized protein A1O5_11606 [Cladophialophora psammophila CBS 110553]EXJ63285.1 hypothetical protein A1O5_11606 [Cladophialophora psammophila CBS 110553]
MEHLISPTELDRMRPSIPESQWLEFDHDSSQRFPLASFEEYPLLRGWNAVRLRALRQGLFLENTDYVSILAMLQGWLFFGVLESAFQQHFSSSSFLTSSEGIQTTGKSHHRVLNTQYLRTFYQQWHLGFLDLPEDRQKSLSVSFGRSVVGARDWALYLEVKLRLRIPAYNSNPLSNIFNATIRNALLLTELLGKAVPQAYPDAGLINYQMDLDPGGEIKGRLRRSGWCPSSSRIMTNRYGHSAAMYATLLRPIEQPHVRHTHCSNTQCKAYNVDVSTYSPQHVHQGCSCEHVLPPLKDVFDILQSGTFPVLDGESIIMDGERGELSVKRYKPDMEYVVISHVWSDGLGSTTEKGLPRCQVVQLAHLCHRISGSSLFWIDGLCVPNDSIMRNTAIQLMSATYAKAPTTLVLDYGLRQSSSSSATEEIAIRILSSVWLRRLWTLKEGILASNLVFRLRDAFLPMSHLLSQIFVSGFTGPISAALIAELSGFNRNLYATKPAHINHIQRLMCYRTSSRLDDETLAIAPLFHIDIGIIMQYSGEARMIAFWKALGTVPGGLIFSGAPRLTTRGFRWAPRTLMHGTGLNDLGRNYGRITENGFVGEFLVLEFDERLVLPRNRSLRLLDIKGKRGFRVLEDVEPQSSDGHDHGSRDNVWGDMIAIREQPTGEILPGVAIVLRREENTDKTEHDDKGVPTCAFAARVIIAVDEFVDLVSWESTPPSDANMVTSVVKTICIC